MSTPKETIKDSILCHIAVSIKPPFDFRKATISIHDFNLSENKKSEHHISTLAGVMLDL